MQRPEAKAMEVPETPPPPKPNPKPKPPTMKSRISRIFNMIKGKSLEKEREAIQGLELSAAEKERLLEAIREREKQLELRASVVSSTEVLREDQRIRALRDLRSFANTEISRLYKLKNPRDEKLRGICVAHKLTKKRFVPKTKEKQKQRGKTIVKAETIAYKLDREEGSVTLGWTKFVKRSEHEVWTREKVKETAMQRYLKCPNTIFLPKIFDEKDKLEAYIFKYGTREKGKRNRRDEDENNEKCSTGDNVVIANV